MVEETAALASRLSRRLRKRGWSIATAESCTGGLLASTFTDISGATNWFDQGWVVYNNEAKMRELGVEKSAFDQGEAGAVSHQVALQMARGSLAIALMPRCQLLSPVSLDRVEQHLPKK